MAIPTQIGDVLILRTTQTYTIHVVGRVSTLGQQDFSNANPRYEHDYAVAVALARTLAVPGRRILLNDIDTGEWSVIQTDG